MKLDKMRFISRYCEIRIRNIRANIPVFMNLRIYIYYLYKIRRSAQ